MSEARFICQDCDWRGGESELLRAPNPFADENPDEMIGCPRCREPNTMRQACDESGCWREASMGTPVHGGYRRTCYDHRPSTLIASQPDRSGE